MLYATLKLLALAVMRLLFRVQASGREHVPRRGPVLIVANHSSLIDPPIVGGVVPRPCSFMAKAELFSIPVFGALIWRLNARPVRRDGAGAGALRAALRVLQEDRVLLVFPEGTRGEEGRLRPARPGAGMLAVVSGVPVVPAFIRGSGAAWPKGRRLPRPRNITVTFGPPLRFERRDDVDRKIQYESASRAMMDAIARLADPSTTDPAASTGDRVTTSWRQPAERAGVPAARPTTRDGRTGQHEHA
jgi:1-acyl-sn-glycerol-3-phosphate acyltransferase